MHQDEAREAVRSPGRRDQAPKVDDDDRLLREVVNGLYEEVHLRPDPCAVGQCEADKAHEGLRQPAVGGPQARGRSCEAFVDEELRQRAEAGLAESRQRLVEVPVRFAQSEMTPIVLPCRAGGQRPGAGPRPGRLGRLDRVLWLAQREAEPRYGLHQRQVLQGVHPVHDPGTERDLGEQRGVLRDGEAQSLDAHPLLQQHAAPLGLPASAGIARGGRQDRVEEEGQRERIPQREGRHSASPLGLKASMSGTIRA
mmetsp:Transcript_109861/g.342430  ORF Transcript_109861/g.342430 Transcript_109861/m.342430 type:complete len:254 (-) Transcript_109861:27-788(-)